MIKKPVLKPQNPFFSSGPCQKHPHWSLDRLKSALISRSHRSAAGKNKLLEVIERSKKILAIPDDYLVGIVPGSDTGAIEMAMWNLLGARPVTVLSWDVFCLDWLKDITNHLKLHNTHILKASSHELPDLTTVDPSHDMVLVWNGTTSGMRPANHRWICQPRSGLTICDATSAVFAMDLPWEHLDATTFSWQKSLGGEAGHGMLILSPRAIQRLASYTPPWPLPKVFRLTENGVLKRGIFSGETLNTPSFLCVEDYLSSLTWAEGIGGLHALIQRTENNLTAVTDWIKPRTSWIDFTAKHPEERSPTSICLKLTDPRIATLSKDDQWALVQDITLRLEKESVAFDLKGHALDAPCIRLWGGPTVETADIQSLLPWIEWSYHQHSGQ